MTESNFDPHFLQSLLLIVLLTLPLKGWAMWRAARSEQKGWYIAILLVNTFGILELTYLFYFSKQPPKDQE